MRIAIDPGHGMSNRQPGVYDPGATAHTSTEAEVVLDWGLTGKFILEGMGIDTYLTRRNKSISTPLGNRVPAALRAGCTHFISLHCNSHSSPWATGTEVYYRGTEDLPLARMALEAALQATKLDNRGVRVESSSQHNRLAVLDFPGPACLLEIGFISHPTDRAVLLERNTRIIFWTLLGNALKGA